MKNIKLMGVLFLFLSGCASVPVLAQSCKEYLTEVLSSAQGYKAATEAACGPILVEVPGSITVHEGAGNAVLSIGGVDFCYIGGRLAGYNHSACGGSRFEAFSPALLHPGQEVTFEVLGHGSASVQVWGDALGGNK